MRTTTRDTLILLCTFVCFSSPPFKYHCRTVIFLAQLHVHLTWHRSRLSRHETFNANMSSVHTHGKTKNSLCWKADRMCASCLLLLTIPGLLHEVSIHLSLVRPVQVGGDERVAAIVEVRGGVQLQAAVKLSLCDVVDPRLDVESLRHQLVVQKPLQRWLGVPWRGDNQALVCQRSLCRSQSLKLRLLI